MPKLVLFDIDGTLVLTGGAGIRAMNRACEMVIGHPDALDGVPVAGRTDWIILHDALHKIGRDLDDDLFAQLRDAYLGLLPEEIARPGHGVKAMMPGIPEILNQLAVRSDVFLALVTGNFHQAARVKLEHFDLWRYFRCGAFGDDAADRNALVPIAIDRAQGCGMAAVGPRDVFVIGDTPHDIACAHAVGAVSIGVATGSFSTDALRESGAAFVFTDLSDASAVARIVDGPEGSKPAEGAKAGGSA